MHPPHPASAATDVPALPLVEIILLKWLLAGEGIRLHVEQLQSDPGYALRALDEAAACASPALRAAALRLRNRLQPAL
jgi:hypothetical protein